jgi:hypothetical protein
MDRCRKDELHMMRDGIVLSYGIYRTQRLRGAQLPLDTYGIPWYLVSNLSNIL